MGQPILSPFPRAYFLGAGVERTAMVPYADMLNHYRPRETSWAYEQSAVGFVMTSLSALQPGQQVMDSYGKKCNRWSSAE
jgi:histone-lysine N-methyltransferase SETD3